MKIYTFALLCLFCCCCCCCSSLALAQTFVDIPTNSDDFALADRDQPTATFIVRGTAGSGSPTTRCHIQFTNLNVRRLSVSASFSDRCTVSVTDSKFADGIDFTGDFGAGTSFVADRIESNASKDVFALRLFPAAQNGLVNVTVANSYLARETVDGTMDLTPTSLTTRCGGSAAGVAATLCIVAPSCGAGAGAAATKKCEENKHFYFEHDRRDDDAAVVGSDYTIEHQIAAVVIVLRSVTLISRNFGSLAYAQREASGLALGYGDPTKYDFCQCMAFRASAVTVRVLGFDVGRNVASLVSLVGLHLQAVPWSVAVRASDLRLDRGGTALSITLGMGTEVSQFPVRIIDITGSRFRSNCMCAPSEGYGAVRGTAALQHRVLSSAPMIAKVIVNSTLIRFTGNNVDDFVAKLPGVLLHEPLVGNCSVSYFEVERNFINLTAAAVAQGTTVSGPTAFQMSALVGMKRYVVSRNRAWLSNVGGTSQFVTAARVVIIDDDANAPTVGSFLIADNEVDHIPLARTATADNLFLFDFKAISSSSSRFEIVRNVYRTGGSAGASVMAGFISSVPTTSTPATDPRLRRVTGNISTLILKDNIFEVVSLFEVSTTIVQADVMQCEASSTSLMLMQNNTLRTTLKGTFTLVNMFTFPARHPQYFNNITVTGNTLETSESALQVVFLQSSQKQPFHVSNVVILRHNRLVFRHYGDPSYALLAILLQQGEATREVTHIERLIVEQNHFESDFQGKLQAYDQALLDVRSPYTGRTVSVTDNTLIVARSAYRLSGPVFAKAVNLSESLIVARNAYRVLEQTADVMVFQSVTELKTVPAFGDPRTKLVIEHNSVVGNVSRIIELVVFAVAYETVVTAASVDISHNVVKNTHPNYGANVILNSCGLNVSSGLRIVNNSLTGSGGRTAHDDMFSSKTMMSSQSIYIEGFEKHNGPIEIADNVQEGVNYDLLSLNGGQSYGMLSKPVVVRNNTLFTSNDAGVENYLVSFTCLARLSYLTIDAPLIVEGNNVSYVGVNNRDGYTQSDMQVVALQARSFKARGVRPMNVTSRGRIVIAHNSFVVTGENITRSSLLRFNTDADDQVNFFPGAGGGGGGDDAAVVLSIHDNSGLLEATQVISLMQTRSAIGGVVHFGNRSVVIRNNHFSVFALPNAEEEALKKQSPTKLVDPTAIGIVVGFPFTTNANSNIKSNNAALIIENNTMKLSDSPMFPQSSPSGVQAASAVAMTALCIGCIELDWKNSFHISRNIKTPICHNKTGDRRCSYIVANNNIDASTTLRVKTEVMVVSSLLRLPPTRVNFQTLSPLGPLLLQLTGNRVALHLNSASSSVAAPLLGQASVPLVGDRRLLGVENPPQLLQQPFAGSSNVSLVIGPPCNRLEFPHQSSKAGHHHRQFVRPYFQQTFPGANFVTAITSSSSSSSSSSGGDSSSAVCESASLSQTFPTQTRSAPELSLTESIPVTRSSRTGSETAPSRTEPSDLFSRSLRRNTESLSESRTYEPPPFRALGWSASAQEVALGVMQVTASVSAMSSPTAIMSVSRGTAVFALMDCASGRDPHGVPWTESELSFPESVLPGVSIGQKRGGYARAAIISFWCVIVAAALVGIVSGVFGTYGAAAAVPALLCGCSNGLEWWVNIVAVSPVPHFVGGAIAFVAAFWCRSVGLIVASVDRSAFLLDVVVIVLLPLALFVYFMAYPFLKVFGQTAVLGSGSRTFGVVRSVAVPNFAELKASVAHHEEEEERDHKDDDGKSQLLLTADKNKNKKESKTSEEFDVVVADKEDAVEEPPQPAWRKNISEKLAAFGNTAVGRFCVVGHIVWESTVEGSPSWLVKERARVFLKCSGPWRKMKASEREDERTRLPTTTSKKTSTSPKPRHKHHDQEQKNKNNKEAPLIIIVDGEEANTNYSQQSSQEGCSSPSSPSYLAATGSRLATLNFFISLLLAVLVAFPLGVAQAQPQACHGVLIWTVIVNTIALLLTVAMRANILPIINVCLIAMDSASMIAGFIALSATTSGNDGADGGARARRQLDDTAATVQMIITVIMSVGGFVVIGARALRFACIRIFGVKIAPLHTFVRLSTAKEEQEQLRATEEMKNKDEADKKNKNKKTVENIHAALQKLEQAELDAAVPPPDPPKPPAPLLADGDFDDDIGVPPLHVASAIYHSPRSASAPTNIINTASNSYPGTTNKNATATTTSSSSSPVKQLDLSWEEKFAAIDAGMRHFHRARSFSRIASDGGVASDNDSADDDDAAHNNALTHKKFHTALDSLFPDV